MALAQSSFNSKIKSNLSAEVCGHVDIRADAVLPKFSFPKRFCDKLSKSTSVHSNSSEFGSRRSRLSQIFFSASLQSTPQTKTSQSHNGADRPSPAELARTLLELCKEGTLSSINADGWPVGTCARFSVDSEGSPVLCLQSQSIHAINLSNDNRCSLHVNVVLPGNQKPQCTLKGRIITPEDDISKLKMEMAWKKRFEKDEDEKIKEDNTMCTMEIDQVYICKGFEEEAEWISAVDYHLALPDPLRRCAAKIVEDMNREHWEDIRRFCYAFANIDAEIDEANIIWVDRIGFDLRALTRNPKETRQVRIRFPREVSDDRDARSSIMMMAQLAWERERNYIPPEIPLLGNPRVA